MITPLFIGKHPNNICFYVVAIFMHFRFGYFHYFFLTHVYCNMTRYFPPFFHKNSLMYRLTYSKTAPQTRSGFVIMHLSDAYTVS